MSIIDLSHRRFMIRKLEDDYFIFKRKSITPPHILVFPEEADRLHEAGHDVFVVEKSEEDPSRYVLRVFPNPYKLIRKDGFWIRKLGAFNLTVAKSTEGRPKLPEVEPGQTGFFVISLTGDYNAASLQGLKFIQSIGQPGFLFDFTENYINVIHKMKAN